MTQPASATGSLYKKALVTTIVSSALGLGQLPIFAQQENGNKEETVTITASRFKEQSARLPTSITVITKEDIERSNAIQLAQLLRNVSGVQLSSTGGKTIVSMRGISAEQSTNNVLIQVDGRRLNYTDIAAPDLESILVSDIERVEIIRGAASALYGDQAVAGVINIITRSGQTKDSTANLLVGNFGTVQGNVNLSRELNPNWSVLLSGNYLETDNYRQHNEQEQQQFALKFNYLTEKSDWLFEYNSNDEKLNTPGALLESELSSPTFSRPEFENDYVDSKQDVLRVFGQETIDQNWTYALDINYVDSDIDSVNSFLNFPTNTVNKTQREQLSIYPRLKGQFITDSGSIDWTNGIDIDDASYDFSLLGRANDQQVHSFYSQLLFPFSNRTDLQLAWRLAKVEDRLTDAALYPQGVKLTNSAHAYDIGLIRQYSNKSKSYLRYSKNFRFAKVDEQAYTAEGVTGLEPQTGQSIELGWEGASEYGILSLSGYELKLEGEIFFDPSSTPPAGAFFPGANVNGGNSKRLGAMIDYQLELNKRWQIGLNYHYVDADISRNDINDNTVPGVSKHSANGWFDFQLNPAANWYLEVNYRGERYQEGDLANSFEPIDDYTLVNTAFNWRLDTFGLGLRVDNLLDEDYISYAQFNGFYPASGRYAYVKLSYQF
ncbi:TonB-dependent receptor [Kangiella sediminilitoris]|uniref:TonB-dependent receptor plug n=1 Tax=Kangiella sediminilitoris TaxID=1144748 RepID=A0A1B3B9S8_9GAMM|nr:TonB-dependent receptor [Kangiella sediminilitoris]AOE49535.1 TonB-dependent receptor plug [Kangiella sediminilitoris]